MTYTGERNSKHQRHGQGTETFADGAVAFTGEWKYGWRHGHGTETLHDCTKRTGEWKDGKLVP